MSYPTSVPRQELNQQHHQHCESIVNQLNTRNAKIKKYFCYLFHKCLNNHELETDMREREIFNLEIFIGYIINNIYNMKCYIYYYKCYIYLFMTVYILHEMMFPTY